MSKPETTVPAVRTYGETSGRTDTVCALPASASARAIKSVCAARPVTGGAVTDAVEDLDRSSSGVFLRLQHDRADGTDQDGFSHAALPVLRYIARDFTAAGGVPNVHSIPEVKRCCEFSDVRRIRVHIITGECLRGPPMTPAVMGNHTIPMLQEKHHLSVPIVR